MEEKREELLKKRKECQDIIEELDKKLETLNKEYYYKKLISIIALLRELPEFYETDDIIIDIECFECGEARTINYNDILKCFEDFERKVKWEWE